MSRNRFTGELLAAFLRRECSVSSVVSEDISKAAPPEWQRDSQPWLLLIDASDHHPDELLHHLDKFKTSYEPQPILALYGLAPNTGIEQEALAVGVRGFFYIGEDPRSLKKAVTALCAGEVWLTRDHMVRCLLGTKPRRSSQSLPPITNRETEILQLLREGLGNHEIAEQLHISYHTVKTHVFRIFKKTGVSSRWEAGIWAAENL